MDAHLLGNWRFECVLGARTAVPGKPGPFEALEKAALMGVLPRGFLYVGGTSVDTRTAVAVGVHPVGVLHGFRGTEELRGVGAKSLIRSLADLFDLLWLDAGLLTTQLNP